MAFSALTVLCALLAVFDSSAAKKAKRSLIVNNAKPASSSVFDRGLVDDHQHYRSILLEHSRHWENVEHRHFNGTVLAYVTPWNSKGYDIAVKFRSKFTHISPVWYQLKGLSSGPELAGQHDVDSTWIQKLKAPGATVKVVPRVMVEGPLLEEMLTREAHTAKAVDAIIAECSKHKYDGVVLEAWSAWQQAALLDSPALRAKAFEFVRTLSRAMKNEGKELLFVIPPPGRGGSPESVFNGADLRALSADVAGFSLMTYDFSSPYSPGPNAPFNWVQSCLMYFLPHLRPQHVEAFQEEGRGRVLKDGDLTNDPISKKLLLGLNFYGNKFLKPQGGGPIVGHEFLGLLDAHRPHLHWDYSAKEHYFTITSSETGTEHEVFYPTLQSIATRIDEARAWGAGISIWEIGQGLDFFYDLL